MHKAEKCILTNICLIYKDDQILVIDRKKKDWPGLTFPGGHVERNENFNDSVIREVYEETGLRIKKPILCGIEEFKTKDEDRYLMLYYKSDRFSGKIRSSKEGEVFWISRKDLDKYKLSLDLKRILKVMESDELSEIKKSNDKIISENTEKLEALVNEKDKVNKKHKEFLNRREELTAEIGRMDKAIFTCNNNIEKVTEKKDGQINYMWEEYELTYSAASQLVNENSENAADELSRSALKKEIATVKGDIKGLGDVNVNAIEEYKEVSERYNFLSAQRDDIVEAEDNLRNIIAELEKAMKDTFNAKFKDIQEMFQKVFHELFGGGKATLSLVDEEDILESGIIINAQPPGKKLQNMMQLSGGEKSLTAIALLFAIQSLKPSPFCLLDEIEAALDDSNVKRFAKYLDKLTKDTQFIVITHRRGTMESADILYGITMQEKGVSTLVSVNLIEDKLDD